MNVLKKDDIEQRVKEYEGWNLIDGKLEANFSYKDFKEALAYVNKIGEAAEELNHHPDILLHGWNNVKLTLFSHDADGITENDFKLVEMIDKI